MVKNYIKLAWRNLTKNKFSSLINIGGLAVGMAVAILIGLWILDELSFDKSHLNYNRVAQVMQNQNFNGEIKTSRSLPAPTGEELRKLYSSDFKYVAMSSQTWHHILGVGDKKLSISGGFMEPDVTEIFSLKMLKGTRGALKDPSAMLLSQSSAKALFGDTDPINKLVRLDNKSSFKVSGIYEDPPHNTTFRYIEIDFIAPWSYYLTNMLSKNALNDWGDNSYRTYVQLNDHADIVQVSAKIKKLKLVHLTKADMKYNHLLFLHPMSKWHLYSEFKHGIISGGKIQYVWLFGTVGLFVLLLACINFMNLSTARSEKRAKEVGIRKALGSLQRELIIQFYCESLLVAVFAFALALVLVQLVIPFFNIVADKDIAILWGNPLFWLTGIGFTFITGLIAGSYPALYLSSFNPVKVLKGTFKAGRFAAIPRKVLVVVQFSVSIILIMGTIVVFKQIQYAQDRPVGYNRNGLITIEPSTDDVSKHYEALRTELLQSGAVSQIAASTSPPTHVDNNTSGFEWKGKDPALPDDFAIVGVTHEFGKTLGWQFTGGRDFSRQFATDSSGIVVNEAAVKIMGLKNPVGEIVKFWGRSYRVIGVIKNMVMDSPYEPAKQTVFYMNNSAVDYINLRINPHANAHEALSKIERVFKTYSPSEPFAYKFTDEEYAKKFTDEVRIGKLAAFFSLLAIFISCLGLFGMASFMAEQRTKEIGVRKVLGASVFSLWRLISTDFVTLVVIALIIATPLAYYFMHSWLNNYQYRTAISLWVFVVTGLAAITMTLLTVSYQSVKAALMNPVKSLRSE
ncbi:ABC transporter permease [Mucilaginibacter polytrichastri]|uniref:ABC transporter permease n=1 Tax=Mucilaginibacter polytrichastri TaxID=1302689 RepID=A0A1Q5ZUV3_9SPHI|nr:ABC transporter permease [Mucilaginibacter polytrichastri]OKS85551.1 hypothetical protein RG47T_0997 [Mucilaginibacter polytrichastri]SFS36806.1 ABC-type antimicrobial peptide transport system, permease component [Mucilaginibacter polytrichastri]